MGISIIQNPVPVALVDAKGDIFVATADNTVGRLAIGANNTVLTADSAETGGVKWAAVAYPVTLSGTETLSNKTLTTPIINGPTITATGQTPVIHGILLPATHTIIFEGATDDAFETTLQVVDPTADRTISLPNASGTVALISDTEIGSLFFFS